MRHLTILIKWWLRNCSNLSFWDIRTQNSTEIFLILWSSWKLIMTNNLKNLKLKQISRSDGTGTSTIKRELISFSQMRITLDLCQEMNSSWNMNKMDKSNGRVEATSWELLRQKRFVLMSRIQKGHHLNPMQNTLLSSFGNLPLSIGRNKLWRSFSRTRPLFQTIFFTRF